MKNIITAAALLAAGTAFSNAAVTVWEDAPSSASGADTASWDLGGQYGTQWSIVFTVDSATLSSEISTTLLSVNVTGVNASYVNNFTGFVGVTYSGGTLTLITWEDQKQTKDIGFASSGNTTFVLSRDSSGGIGLTAYQDGDFENAIATLSNTISGTYSSTGTTAVFGGVSSTSAAQYAYYVSNDDSEAFSLLGAGYSAGAVAATGDLQSYYSTVIPEPSAFGLLAGVGALALVAARRRRTK